MPSPEGRDAAGDKLERTLSWNVLLLSTFDYAAVLALRPFSGLQPCRFTFCRVSYGIVVRGFKLYSTPVAVAVREQHMGNTTSRKNTTGGKESPGFGLATDGL